MSISRPLVVCWLAQDIGEAGAHLKLKATMKGISNRIAQWHYFDSGDAFTQFVDANPNVNIVAIMSGRFARQKVAEMSDRNALHSVYVFCGNKANYQQLLADEPKIKGLIDTEDELFDRMRRDLQREFP